MENRRTFKIELTMDDLNNLIYALELEENMDGETNSPCLLKELKELLSNGKSTS
jgi:hypothetical protein